MILPILQRSFRSLNPRMEWHSQMLHAVGYGCVRVVHQDHIKWTGRPRGLLLRRDVHVQVRDTSTNIRRCAVLKRPPTFRQVVHNLNHAYYIIYPNYSTT